MIPDALTDTGQSETAKGGRMLDACLEASWDSEGSHQLDEAQVWQCEGVSTCRATSMSRWYFWTSSVMDGSMSS